MSRLDAEHLVAGAGCAGLSFAVQLARRPRAERGRILLVDPRTGFGRDRTWCAFRFEHPFRDAVTHRWARWRVGAGGAAVERGGARPYEEVSSELFYRTALERLLAADGVELTLGVSVSAIERDGDGVVARTSAGPVRARMAWDARGGAPEVRRRPGEVDLRQLFLGWVVRTERPIFDPRVATLMDLGVPQDRGPHFVYVLPYAPDRALVEDTHFTGEAIEKAAHEATLRGWLEAHRAGAFEIEHREEGSLPMRSAPPVAGDPRIVRLGLRGGAAKPSTGYAFAFVQRHAAALAAVAGDGRRPPPEVPVHPPAAALLDRVFLSYLQRHPRQAPRLFTALFDRAPPDALVRFLMEEEGAVDRLAVMAAMPGLGMAAEAARLAVRWPR